MATYTAVITPLANVNYTNTTAAATGAITGVAIIPINYTLIDNYSARPAPIGATARVVLNASEDAPQYSADVTWFAQQSPYLASSTAPGVTLTRAQQTQTTSSSTSPSSAVSTSASTSASSSILTSSSSTEPQTLITSTSSSAPGTTSPPRTQTPVPSRGYSAGSVAGAAIGCAIGGAILAGLIAFLLFRRKRSRYSNRSAIAEKQASRHPAHGEAIYLGATSKAWSKHLPQSESDKTISGQANSILDQIELHVENFYTERTSRSLNGETLSRLDLLNSVHLTAPVASLLQRSNQPTLLIKHCIASSILGKVTSTPEGEGTFLPKDCNALNLSARNQDNPAYGAALSQWRVLTSFLRQGVEHDLAYQQGRDQTITEAAQQICFAFQPWARGDERDRVQGLTNIMKRATDFGILLFSQPSSFHWQWHMPAKNELGKAGKLDPNQIVVLPGLSKMTDQEANPLSPPLQLLKPRPGLLNRA